MPAYILNRNLTTGGGKSGRIMSRGSYTRDFYFLPTVLLHRGDFYVSVELAWLKWYVGVVKESI